MFTGLIEAIGTVKTISPFQPQTKKNNNNNNNKDDDNDNDDYPTSCNSILLTVQDASTVLTDCKIGDSLAINGTCLTVLEFDSYQFTVNISLETLRRTNLGLLKTGDKINLERAMRSDTRFGGHFVQGHVDTTAKIKSISNDGDSLRIIFSLLLNPSTTTSTTPTTTSLTTTNNHYEGLPLSSLLIPKGYITIDGISLTLCQVSSSSSSSNAPNLNLNLTHHHHSSEEQEQEKEKDKESSFEFEVMLIKHTQLHVTLPLKKPGQLVNIEFDCLTKSMAKTLITSLSGIVERTVELALQSRFPSS